MCIAIVVRKLKNKFIFISYFSTKEGVFSTSQAGNTPSFFMLSKCFKEKGRPVNFFQLPYSEEQLNCRRLASGKWQVVMWDQFFNRASSEADCEYPLDWFVLCKVTQCLMSFPVSCR